VPGAAWRIVALALWRRNCRDYIKLVRESPAKAAHMTQVITAVPGLAPKSCGCPNGTEGQS